jgi:hypothetical protein
VFVRRFWTLQREKEPYASRIPILTGAMDQCSNVDRQRRGWPDTRCHEGLWVGKIPDRFTAYEDLAKSIPASARWVIPASAPTASGAMIAQPRVA